MFLLAYPLTESIEIDRETYPLNLAFDNVLRLFDLLGDDELDDVTQVDTALVMLLGVELDMNIEKKSRVLNEVFKQAIGLGEHVEENLDIAGNPMPKESINEERYYCLKQDAEYIYASFMADYRMDLKDQMGKLHWKKFQALLSGLNSNTIFQRIIEIRSADLPTGKGSGEERKRLIELKKRYALKGQEIEDDEKEE